MLGPAAGPLMGTGQGRAGWPGGGSELDLVAVSGVGHPAGAGWGAAGRAEPGAWGEGPQTTLHSPEARDPSPTLAPRSHLQAQDCLPGLSLLHYSFRGGGPRSQVTLDP